MSDLKLRKATVADAETLTELGRATFAQTFGHLYPPEDLAHFLSHQHTPAQYAAWAVDDRHGLWIAERDGDAIAYALAGPCELPHAEVTPNCRELKRIYVTADAQGGGAGTALLHLALGWMAAPGRSLWIGVWSENHGAQRLYARHGFKQVGTYAFEVGQTRDHEFILRRAAE